MPAMLDKARNTYFTVMGRPAADLEGTIIAHSRKVNAVAFFKDGRRVVTGSDDRTVRIWDVQKGTLAAGPFEGHKDSVKSVAVSPDDKLIASGGDTVIIWDVESKQTVFDPLVAHGGGVNSVCFSPDGKRLASGSSYNGTVFIWDVETGKALATLKDSHNDDVLSLAFRPDGLKLACGTSGGNILVWRTDNGKLKLDVSRRHFLKYDNPESDLLLVIHASWRFLPKRGSGVENYYPVRGIVWSPDGKELVSASDDKEVKFWNASTGYPIGQSCTGRLLAISSDGSFIATASSDKVVRLWSTDTRQKIGQALKHASVSCLAISSNGENLASGNDKGEVRFWSNKSMLLPPVETDASAVSRINSDLSNDHNSATRYSSATHEPSGSHASYSWFDIITINLTVFNACIAGELRTAEELLTHDIEAHVNDYHSYANRSVVRARVGEQDQALQDAVQSIATKPSFWGYVSKGVALCNKEQLSDAMEAFDLGFIFSSRDPIVIHLLLLIKAIALFNGSHHDEAMRRVQELATACEHDNTLPCTVVEVYLRVQLAMIAFEDGRYNNCADQLTACDASVTDLMLHEAFSEPRLKIFTWLFGWDLDSLWRNASRKRCEALLRADRVIEAIEYHQYMIDRIDESARNSCLEWSTAFKHDCIVRCVAKGDETLAAGEYRTAIELYSALISLDASCGHSLFAHRGKAHLGQHLYAEALTDAEKVIELNPSSPLGYELKYTVLRGAQRYDEAVEAFKTMLSKLDDTADLQLQDLRQQYISPAEVDDAVQTAMMAQLENTPHRLLNTSTGNLCNREAQINAFKASAEYKKVLVSTIKHSDLGIIQDVVQTYFHCVMLSHRWQRKEPLMSDIQEKSVYELNSDEGMVKLQSFCNTARDAGFHWGWIDTCCIDQSNNVELQESVNSMFVWYRHSALTFVYLSDVPPSSKPGALAQSVWNTRGWTVQEFLAPKIVLFYQQDWTLYLGDQSPNHKESPIIMQELGDRTGIDAQALVAFRPGMRDAREKLQWASTRVTTLQEDMAYSLFGIFGVHLPVIYGEKKQNALGRLLQEIVARSGDITALDWVGKSSEFNSCLPADITPYKAPPRTSTLRSLSEDEIHTSVRSLRNAGVVESASTLYTLLDNTAAPRFAHSRLYLPCIAFIVTEVERRSGQHQDTHFTYEVKAKGLQDLQITTEDVLVQFSPGRRTRRTFLLIRPWNRYDLGLPDFGDDTQSDKDWSDSGSLSNSSFDGSTGENRPVDSESDSRALRLVVQLEQPFGALLLAQQRGGEYKRIAPDQEIIAQVKDTDSVRNMMDIRTLEIL